MKSPSIIRIVALLAVASLLMVPEPASGSPSTGDSSAVEGKERQGQRLSATMGPFAGWRSFQANEQGRPALSLDAPLFGGALEVQYRLPASRVSRWSGRLEAGGTYAPVRWRFQSSDASVYADGHHVAGRLVGELRFEYLPHLQAVGRLGLGALSETVDRNEFYTGSRYIGARLLGGIASQPTEEVEIELLGGVLPTPFLEHAGGSRGETDFSVGWTGRASANLQVSHSLGLALDYALDGWRVTWSDAPRKAFTTTDVHHRLSLSVSLTL